MTPRAAPMSPEARRDALIEATVPLLAEHGRAVTTRQIAQAACVAEGTIFRVFDSKEELVEEALQRAFAWGDFVDRIDAIDPELPLERRLVELVRLIQDRFSAIFGLMRSVGLVAPPGPGHEGDERARWLERVQSAMVAVVAPDAASLRIPPARLVDLLRLLTFSGTHPDISQGRLLKPHEIVDAVLHGVLEENR